MVQWRASRSHTGHGYASQIAQSGQHFKAYSDNPAGLYRLATASDNPGQACQIRAIKAANQIAEKGACISLHWVPGHTDIPGNELADALAKEATVLPLSFQETSLAVLGLKAKRISPDEWRGLLAEAKPTSYSKNYQWKPQSLILIPSGTRRELASSLFQLKLGHGYLKSYLHRLGFSTSDKYRCGQRESPEHLLLSRKELKDPRDK